MKKFFVTLILCLLPFCIRAELPVLIVQTTPTTKADLDAFAELFYDPRPYFEFLPSVFSRLAGLGNDLIGKIVLSNEDDEIIPYVDKEDLKIMQKYYSHFVREKKGDSLDSEGANAAYIPLNDDLIVSSEVKSSSKVRLQETIHHEVQHLKDFMLISEKTGLDPSYFNDGGVDKLTKQVMNGIMEAKAYSSEPYFVYTKMNRLYERVKNLMPAEVSSSKAYEEYNNFKNFYESMLRKNIWYHFNEAIKQGKSPLEARHVAAVAALDIQFTCDGGYMEKISEWGTGDKHYTPNELLELFEDPSDDFNFTVQDLYSADEFWIELCKYNDTKDTTECRAAKRLYQSKYCGKDEENGREAFCGKFKNMVSKYIKLPDIDPMDKDFDVDVVFRKMDKLFETDENCTSKACKSKKRILTTQEDANFYNKSGLLSDDYKENSYNGTSNKESVPNKRRYRVCCTLDWDFNEAVPTTCGEIHQHGEVWK